MQLSKKLQEILNHISSLRQKLFDEASGLSEAQLDYRPAEGEWSINDILHHMALTDEASLKLAGNMLKQARERQLPPDPTPEASVLDSLDSFTAKMTDGKFQAPDRVAPRSHLPSAESLARLTASREKIIATVAELTAYDLSGLTYPHPAFGDLNGYQWLIISGRHESRHAAQIARIKANPDFPS